jgi:hypothetical protein
MYRLMGTTLSVPLGNNYTLGLTSEDTAVVLGDIWDLDSFLADLDTRKNSDEVIPQ